ncbi:hypothetical protein CN354_16380 [Bacillus cereus]|nr:hypothetical protein CN354_16380 [Bacillus cereus]
MLRVGVIPFFVFGGELYCMKGHFTLSSLKIYIYILCVITVINFLKISDDFVEEFQGFSAE